MDLSKSEVSQTRSEARRERLRTLEVMAPFIATVLLFIFIAVFIAAPRIAEISSGISDSMEQARETEAPPLR